MKYLPGSLEIKLYERLSKTDILDILAEQMTMLEETFGIEEFSLNYYLGCYIDSKKQSFYHEEHNAIVESFNLKNDTKLENTSKLISKNGNARIVSFDKNTLLSSIVFFNLNSANGLYILESTKSLILLIPDTTL